MTLSHFRFQPHRRRLYLAVTLLAGTAITSPAMAQTLPSLLVGGGGGGGYGGYFGGGGGGGGASNASVPGAAGGGVLSGAGSGIGGGGGGGGYEVGQPIGTTGPSVPMPGAAYSGADGSAGATASGTGEATGGAGGTGGGAGGTALQSNGGGGGGGAGTVGTLSPNGSSPQNGENATYSMGSGAFNIITVGGGGGGGGGADANMSAGAGEVGGNGGNGTLTIGGAVTTDQFDIGGIGGGGGTSSITGVATGGVGGNGGNGLVTVNGALTANQLTVGRSGGTTLLLGSYTPGQGAIANQGNSGNGTLLVSGSVTAGTVADGGAGGAGDNYGSNGGNGGTGSITVAGAAARFTVTNAMTIGGNGGANGMGIGQHNIPVPSSGGVGGNGIFTLENNGTLVLGNNVAVNVPSTSAPVNAAASGTANFAISGTANIEVDSGASAVINAPVNDIFGSPAGILTKDGNGTLYMTGVNTYSGGTVINGGILKVNNYNDSVNGPLTVFVSPNTVPGTGYGQLQVEGQAALSKTLTLEIATPTAGTAYAIGSTYQVVATTAGVSGKFSNTALVGPYAPYLTALTSYSTYAVNVELLASQAAFDTGRFYAANGYAQNAALFASLALPTQADKGYWLHGIGSFGHAPGVDYNYKGFVVGRGFAVSPNLIIGGAVSNIYTHTAGHNASTVDGTTVGGEAYGIYTRHAYNLTGVVAMGHLGNQATRYLPGVGAGKFKPDGIYEGASLRVQYNGWNSGAVFMSPYASLSYMHTHMGRGQEAGLGAMNISYSQVNTSLAQAGGGLMSGYTSMTSRGNLTIWGALGGLATLGNTRSRVNETVGTQMASTTGQIASAGAFTPSAGIQLLGKARPWKLAADWQGQFASHAAAQAFTLQGSYKFF